MDLDWIIRELLAEHRRLNHMIRAMEEPGRKAPAAKSSKNNKLTGERRGRKFMDGPARQEVSERMTRYWAMRRAKATRPKPDAAHVSPSGPGCASIETRGQRESSRSLHRMMA